jgi:hypothetical protein
VIISPKQESARNYYLKTRESQLAKSKERYAANKEQRRASNRARYVAQREKVLAAQKERVKADPGKRYEIYRRAHLKGKYGMTHQEYDAMLDTQGGRCGICGVSEPGGRYDIWFVDHCHNSLEVRGLLCHSCNSMIGLAKDSVDNLASAIKYLLKAQP